MDRSPDEVPGPGAYRSESPLTKTSKGASFGVGQKFDTSAEREKAQLPGPGKYSPERKFHTSQYSFGGGRHPEPLNKTPGSGSYDVEVKEK